jgi:DNA-binding beta-propeller fold protein YncE
MEVMKMNKLFKNITMGIFAVILLTSTLTLGVKNGFNTPVLNIEGNNHGNENNVEKNNNVDNKIKASQHPIVQIAEAVTEIPNEGNYEKYVPEKEDSYSKQKELGKEPSSQYNSIETTPEYGKVNEVTIKAEKLPNGQYAYKMVEHLLIDGDSKEDLTYRYLSPDDTLIPTIPGPTIEINQNDLLIIHSIDEEGKQKTQRIEPKEIGSFEYFGDRFRTLGLFGAIIVNPIDKVPAQIDGKVVSVDVNSLDKQFVLFMVGSTFWGQEIDQNHKQRPLWTNPHLGADLNQVIRFHILGAAHQHTFHLHAHRWLDPGTTNIIDTKLIQPNSPHWFIVEAGDRVGVGDWQYHCHVFAHMEAGMMGTFTVGNVDSNTKSYAGPGPSISSGPYEKEGQGNFITFDITDQPGQWFKNVGGEVQVPGEVKPYTTQSLGIVESYGTAHFIMSGTNTVHTITSLLWPTGAPNMPFDEMTAYRGGGIVQLEKPGLYVFTCKIHPYMLGGMIVDDPQTRGLDIGEELTLSTSDVLDPIDDTSGKADDAAILNALALLRTFFVANNPDNWIDYNKQTWSPNFPNVEINFGGMVANLNKKIIETIGGRDTINLGALRGEKELEVPKQKGIGEVWINTQFEKTAEKSKPGTATRINVQDWTVERKVALPQINMNNPHNMWSDREQKIIYQTQWFDNLLTAFDRETGKLIDNIRVGDAPSHVMTTPLNDLIYVALSGEQGVAEIQFNKDTNKFEMQRIIPTQDAGQAPTHPHAQWITTDGTKMITPNHFTDDATIIDFDEKAQGKKEIQSRTMTGKMPIATGITPDGQTAYVSNFLSSTITVVDIKSGKEIDEIKLISPKNSLLTLPIQTPVSPDGKYVVTANTLTGEIIIIDTSNNEIVKRLPCDPGCHGVNFGAKEGGGYYAYVSSKFSNRLIVVDLYPDANNDRIPERPNIAGSVLLTGDYDLLGKPAFEADDKIIENRGMGGQGVYAIPNAYPGWVFTLDTDWDLTSDQRNPLHVYETNQDQLEQNEQQSQQQLQQQPEHQEIQQLQQQQQLQASQSMESHNNQVGSNSNNDVNTQLMQAPQQHQTSPETFADKIAKQRQQILNPGLTTNPQFTTQQKGSVTSMINEPEQQQQQEKTTTQSIEEKLAQIQQQSIRQAIVPELMEKKVNPSLDKAGNIISMLPVPLP